MVKVSLIFLVLMTMVVLFFLSAYAQQDSDTLELELAQMDLISMCDMALTISSDSPGSVGEETLAACDRNMLDIRDYCVDRPGLITCADERIQNYISARGI
jgi:hypothetical protein